MSAPFHLIIMTPEKIFFDGQTEHVIARTTEGDIGIMAKHISYVAALPAGALKVKQQDGKFRYSALSSGLIKVSSDKVTIIANAVEWADEIDLDWAKRSEEDARHRLEALQSGQEFERAQLKLQRALNRITVSENYSE